MRCFEWCRLSFLSPTDILFFYDDPFAVLCETMPEVGGQHEWKGCGQIQESSGTKRRLLNQHSGTGKADLRLRPSCVFFCPPSTLHPTPLSLHSPDTHTVSEYVLKTKFKGTMACHHWNLCLCPTRLPILITTLA